MAWKAIRGLSGYKMGLCYADGQVIESPDNIVSNSILVVGNTPISCPSLPTNTGDLRFNIASNLYLNFNFNYVGDSSYRTNSAYCWAYIDNQTAGWWSGGFGCGGDYTRYSDILAFVDEENQKACFVWRYHYKYRWGSPGALYDQDGAERSNSSYDSAIYTAIKPYITVSSSGGGATHIAKVTGQLKDLSNNLSDILIVSGGGGGGLINGSNVVNGADAGGISGSGNNSANQSTGYAFGLGEDGANLSGGGGGLYGGYKGSSSVSGGAGSGYIGNSLLSEKKMIGFNVPTSSTAGTKTESVNVYSANSEANKPKAGNGHARIICLRPTQSSTFFEANFNTDGRDKVHYKDINVTETLRDYYYAEVTKTMKQGQCISFFGNDVWDISNGSLNVSSVTDAGGSLFFWGYDPSQIEQYVFPENCTVVIEAEVLFTTALDPDIVDDNRVITFAAYTRLYPSEAAYIFSGDATINNHQVNTWYSVRMELKIVNGAIENSETIGYLDNVLMPDEDVVSFGMWVGIDTTEGEHYDCCGIGVYAINPMKIRKYKISYRT